MKDLLAETKRLSEEVKSSHTSFLRTELDLAATFARMAMESTDQQKRSRTARQARLAYDTVLRFLVRVALTDAEQEDMYNRLASVKSNLQILGQTF
jgi:hypothetical protein